MHETVTSGLLLQTHCYASLSIPTRNGSVVHVRRPGTPEGCHQQIYEKFGIDCKELLAKKITAAIKMPAIL